MSQALVLKETDGRVALLTLNSPAKRNAMNYALVDALNVALKEVEADPEVRVAVIAGAGDHFSAGGDLQEFAQELGLSAHRHWKSADGWIALFRLVRAMRKPVIAAVQGYALAGGCGLVALCDMAIASEDARLGTTEIRIGLFPMIILPTLRRIIGERKTLEMALTGRIITGQEAERIGLVNEVVSRETLLETAISRAASIARKGPAAIGMGKSLFYATQDMGYDEALEFARSIRVAYMLADDVAIGVEAFLNKRKPNWD